MRRIAVAGASGLIGNALVRSLTADGHEVRRLVRRAARGPQEVCWDPEREYVDAAGLAGCDAVVNLAGAGVGDRRWSEAYKKRIHDSRVLGTRALARAVAALDEPPRVLVNGSAMGIYGETGERIADEDAPPGRGSCRSCAWSGRPRRRPPRRRACGRRSRAPDWSWPVRGRLGAAVPAVQGRARGRMGDGRQYWSYIALHDEVAAIRHLLDRDDLSGPFNLTAPEPLTNREITEAMGRVLGRPTVFAVPAPVLRTVLGEMAGDVLGSARVVPRRLLESGFRFAFPGIDDAIRAALA